MVVKTFIYVYIYIYREVPLYMDDAIFTFGLTRSVHAIVRQDGLRDDSPAIPAVVLTRCVNHYFSLGGKTNVRYFIASEHFPSYIGHSLHTEHPT